VPVVTRALVLAGGGLVGIAWELGVLLGLRGQGADPRGWDRIVGTSAGAVVGAAVGTDGGLDALRKTRWVERVTELEAYQRTLDHAAVEEIDRLWFARPEGPDRATRAEIGRRALAMTLEDEGRYLESIAELLPGRDWPRRLVTTAVDAEDGSFRTFDAASGVSLVAAVAASCAIPGVFPPVSIGDRRYVDGGVRSGTCADVATGNDLVLLVAPTRPDGPWSARQATEVAGLRAAGSRVVEITPAAGPLEPGPLSDVLEAGVAVGVASAPRVREAEAA